MKHASLLAALLAVLAGCTAPATEPAAAAPETGKEAARPAPAWMSEFNSGRNDSESVAALHHALIAE